MIPDAQLHAEVGRLLGILYAKRFAALDKLSLGRLLSKNPYLYRALGIADSLEFIQQLMIAFVSSSEKPFLVTTSSSRWPFLQLHMAQRPMASCGT